MTAKELAEAILKLPKNEQEFEVFIESEARWTPVFNLVVKKNRDIGAPIVLINEED